MAMTDAEKKAAQRARLREIGQRGREFFLTNDEFQKVKKYVEQIRKAKRG
jgi:hypothetical protein